MVMRPRYLVLILAALPIAFVAVLVHFAPLGHHREASYNTLVNFSEPLRVFRKLKIRKGFGSEPGYSIRRLAILVLFLPVILGACKDRENEMEQDAELAALVRLHNRFCEGPKIGPFDYLFGKYAEIDAESNRFDALYRAAYAREERTFLEDPSIPRGEKCTGVKTRAGKIRSEL